jgi:hypothetical protein
MRPSTLPNSCKKSYSSGSSVLQKLFPKRERGRWGTTVEHILLVADGRDLAIADSVVAAAAAT